MEIELALEVEEVKVDTEKCFNLMNKSKQEFIQNLNPHFVEHQTWMMYMPRSISAIELINRKNPLVFREVKLIETEGDWTHHLVKSQFLKGIALTPKGWRLKVEVHLQETSVYKDPETGNETVSGTPVGNNWDECSVFVHYLEMEAEQVSILRNNFPDIWERL